MKAILDTNFAIIPAQFGIDIYEGIHRIIPKAQITTIKQVVNELEKINNKHSKTALKILKQKKVKIEEEPGSTDTALLQHAQKEKATLCTNDKELKEKARRKGIPVIIMRKKQYLKLTR